MYNDGVIVVVKSKSKKTSFSGKINELSLKDFDEIGNFYFHEESKRQQDIEFVHSLDRVLNMKIKIPFTKTVTSNYKVVYDNYLYDIIYTDYSKDKTSLF